MTAPNVDPRHTLTHNLLVNTDKLQTLPADVLIALLGLNTALIAAVWWLSRGLPEALAVAAGHVLTVALNWWLLRRLPQVGRSFGPDKPPALALAALQALMVGILGILSAPWWLAFVLMGMIGLAAYYATWIEPFRLGVTLQRYNTPHWQASAPPLRLLHISDLHVERITRRERRLNKLIRELQPDIIVFTGDFVNLSYTDDPEAESAIREIIGEWDAPLGVYCVAGTPLVEPAERVAAFVKDFEQIRLLNNHWLTLKTPGGALNLLGLATTHLLKRDRAMLSKMLTKAPQSGLKLLLMHAPDIAPEADAAGFDLYLTGHTHGGQIRLPFWGALITGSHLGKRFVMGRYELKHTTVYTTRGVGMEGLGAPRARFFCKPEIVLWEIMGSQ